MELANFETKEKQIGDNIFYVRALPPLQGIELLGDLQAVFTTGLKDVDVNSKSNGKSNGNKSLLDQNITIGAAIAGIGQNLKGPALVAFTKRLLDPNYVSVKRPGDDTPIRLTPDIYNNIFTGHLSQMLELLYFIVCDVNFDDFFELLPNHTGSLLQNLASQIQQVN